MQVFSLEQIEMVDIEVPKKKNEDSSEIRDALDARLLRYPSMTWKYHGL